MNERNIQIEAVRGWWNIERNKFKWDKLYNGDDVHGKAYLKLRQRQVLNFLKESGMKAGDSVLELGYGAGQAALELGKCGYEVYGLDISEGLCEAANRRCMEGCPEGKFNLRVGNIESNYEFPDKMFDAVVVIGALQYLYNPRTCFNEVFRVLKPGGFFVVAQRNIYSLCNLTTFRDLMRSFTHFILREKYELFPSFRSMLVDSRLGFLFKRFENSKFFNSKFMLKGHDFWKFEIKKRLYSFFSLKSMLKREGFILLRATGAYYCFSEKPKYYQFNLKIDRFIERLVNAGMFPYLFTLGRSVVLLSKKTNQPN